MFRRHVVFLISGLILGSIWFTPAIAALVNADTVNGIGAARRPARGKLLALNRNKKFPNSVLQTGPGRGLNADKVDGRHASGFAASAHNHDSNYVSKTSPSWTPRTSYLSIPPAAWVSGHGSANGTDSITNRDQWAYDTGGGAMFAPVYLPHGAKITHVKFLWSDTAGSDIELYLYSRPIADFDAGKATETGLYSDIGASGSSDLTLTTPIVIDNSAKTYYLGAFFTNSAKKVKTVVFTYTKDGP